MIIYRVKRHNHHQRIGLVDDFPAPKRYVPEFLFKGSRFQGMLPFSERCGQFLS